MVFIVCPISTGTPQLRDVVTPLIGVFHIPLPSFTVHFCPWDQRDDTACGWVWQNWGMVLFLVFRMRDSGDVSCLHGLAICRVVMCHPQSMWSWEHHQALVPGERWLLLSLGFIRWTSVIGFFCAKECFMTVMFQEALTSPPSASVPYADGLNSSEMLSGFYRCSALDGMQILGYPSQASAVAESTHVLPEVHLQQLTWLHMYGHLADAFSLISDEFHSTNVHAHEL